MQESTMDGQACCKSQGRIFELLTGDVIQLAIFREALFELPCSDLSTRQLSVIASFSLMDPPYSISERHDGPFPSGWSILERDRGRNSWRIYATSLIIERRTPDTVFKNFFNSLSSLRSLFES